jgi:hypothetical protein
MLSAFGCTLSYIVSSLLMIGVIYNKTNVYSIGCALLASITNFAILVYFFWLMIAVLMHYFTVKFQLNNFDKYFKILSILSFGLLN